MNRARAIELIRQHAINTKGHSDSPQELREAIELLRVKTIEDIGFEPPEYVTCPNCGGDLITSGKNARRTLLFVDCNGECKWCWVIKLGEADGGFVRIPTEESQEGGNRPRA